MINKHAIKTIDEDGTTILIQAKGVVARAVVNKSTIKVKWFKPITNHRYSLWLVYERGASLYIHFKNINDAELAQSEIGELLGNCD